MNYDGYVLAAVVSELQGKLVGGQIQKIRQHNDTDVTFESGRPETRGCCSSPWIPGSPASI